MSHWATVGPVNPEWRGPTFDVAEGIDIGWGVHLVPLPAWLKQQNITRYMSWVERERYIGEAKYALWVEYEADSLGEPDPLSTMGPMSKQHVAAERLRRANLALWLARPSWAGFRVVKPLEGLDRSTSFWAFLRAFGVRWFVFMSGPLTVPFTFAALYVDSAWLKSLFALLAITCAAFACYWVWRHERHRKIEIFEQAEPLRARLEPKLVFVMQDCCRRHWQLGVVGVANPSAVTVEDARVYLSIPTLQIDDRVVNWAGMKPDEGLDIHPAPLSRHHHTSYFVSVGDNPGQFFFHPAHGSAQTIEPGNYVAELCVRGRNAAATIARVEIIWALPRSFTVRLLPEEGS